MKAASAGGTGSHAVGPLASYIAHRAEIDAALRRVLESGSYILGDEVTQFEAEFASYCGASASVGVGTGTDAVELALRACGVEAGDVVLTVSHTAVATVAAVERCGAVPVFVDIDPSTFTMAADQLEATLGRMAKGSSQSRIGAVLVVHLYGHPAALVEILQLAIGRGIPVVEDCAQAHGSKYSGRAVGTWGAAGAFSFYPTKNLGTFGDGGAVVTMDDVVARRVTMLREYGWRERFVSEVVGVNSRLDELHAAILRVRLRHLDAENDHRRQIAHCYTTLLGDLPLKTPPLGSDDLQPAFHQYVIRTSGRDELRQFLRGRDIPTAVHYPLPVHLQPAYRDRVRAPAGLSVTESVTREILSLPIGPYVTEDAARATASTIAEWFGTRS